MKYLKIGMFLFSVALLSGLSSCKKEPSIIKIFVRSDSNAKVKDAKVIIISDVAVNGYKTEDVDTLFTNVDGVAEFNKDDYFKNAGKKNTVAYFDIVVKYGTKVGEGRIRSRAHTTSVETVYLPN